MQKIRNRDYKALVVPQQHCWIVCRRLVFAKAELKLELGDLIEPEQVCEQLLSAGYERAKIAEQTGQFVRHGDVIDIVIAAATAELPPQGLRISFFDIEIDDLREIDLETQRSIQSLSRIAIPPTKELLLKQEQLAELACEIREISEEAADAVLRRGGTREEYEQMRQLGLKMERLESRFFAPWTAGCPWSINNPPVCLIMPCRIPDSGWMVSRFSKQLDAAAALWLQDLLPY